MCSPYLFSFYIQLLAFTNSQTTCSSLTIPQGFTNPLLGNPVLEPFLYMFLDISDICFLWEQVVSGACKTRASWYPGNDVLFAMSFTVVNHMFCESAHLPPSRDRETAWEEEDCLLTGIIRWSTSAGFCEWWIYAGFSFSTAVVRMVCIVTSCVRNQQTS